MPEAEPLQCRNNRTILAVQQRLADHEADGNRTQHEWQEKDHAEELASSNLLVQENRQSVGDDVLSHDRCNVVSHVLHRDPEGAVREQPTKIVETGELPPSSGAEIPVLESHEQRIDRWENDEGKRDQHGWQQEHGLLTALPAGPNDAGAQAHRPSDKRDGYWSPVVEPHGSHPEGFK